MQGIKEQLQAIKLELDALPEVFKAARLANTCRSILTLNLVSQAAAQIQDAIDVLSTTELDSYISSIVETFLTSAGASSSTSED